MINRKGSLNLSIQAIVIVVIAFVVLGLGLGFVRGQFKSITETATGVQEQIKQQVLDDLRTGDKKLSFPASEVTINKKESTVVAIGVKNVLQPTLNYKVKVEFKGGTDIFGEDITDNFLYPEDAESLEPTEARVIPIRITSETTAGTGQFKISIEDVSDSANPKLYDSKTFFITIIG
jgi:hypothetical protein